MVCPGISSPTLSFRAPWVLTAGLTWPQFPEGCCHHSTQECLYVCPSWIFEWLCGEPLISSHNTSDCVSSLVKIDQVPILPAPNSLPPGAVSPGQAGHASISISALSLPFPRQLLHPWAAVLCAAHAGSSAKSIAPNSPTRVWAGKYPPTDCYFWATAMCALIRDFWKYFALRWHVTLATVS